MRRNIFTPQQQAKLRRLERAKEILKRGHLFPITGAPGKFICFSQTKQGKAIYLVEHNGAEGSCTCPDFKKRKGEHGGWCKHRIAAMLQVEHPQDWEDWLPEWARGDGSEPPEGNHPLARALAELPDEVLSRLIAYASSELQERDYRRKVKEPGA